MTKDQKIALVEAWKVSGMAPAMFAALNGVSPNTFRFWIQGKNLATKKGRPGPEVKPKYLALRAEGLSASSAAYACGISVTTGKRWDA